MKLLSVIYPSLLFINHAKQFQIHFLHFGADNMLFRRLQFVIDGSIFNFNHDQFRPNDWQFVHVSDPAI